MSSDFYVQMPYNNKMSDYVDQKQREQALAKAGYDRLLKARIMVVDSSDTIRQMMKKYLQSTGASYVGATDGQNAWNILSDQLNHDEVPDLIFMDLELERMNGVDLLRRLKEHEVLRYIPVVIFSRVSEKRLIMECVRLGVASYVTKPSAPAKILQAINQAITRRQANRKTIRQRLDELIIAVQEAHMKSLDADPVRSADIDQDPVYRAFKDYLDEHFG